MLFRSTDKDREQLRKRLMLEDKKNGAYERYEQQLEDKYNNIDDYDTSENPSAALGQGSQHGTDASSPAGMGDDDIVLTAKEKEHHQAIQRKVDKLHNLINDKAASEGEKLAANRQIMRLTPELIEGRYLVKIEQKIDRMERQRLKMHVRELSFNSYYEFALERIPQICAEKKIDFEIGRAHV